MRTNFRITRYVHGQLTGGLTRNYAGSVGGGVTLHATECRLVGPVSLVDVAAFGALPTGIPRIEYYPRLFDSWQLQNTRSANALRFLRMADASDFRAEGISMNLRIRLLLDFYLAGMLHAILKIPTILLGKVMGRNHDLSNGRQVAVMKLLGGGNLVIAYPTLLALKRLPHVEKLTLVTTPAIKPFGDTLGIFDEVIVIREDSVLQLGLDSLKAIGQLFRHDAIVDFEIHSRARERIFVCASPPIRLRSCC